jgi:hypothetical protein
MTGRLAAQAACLLRAPWQWRRNDGSLWALSLYAGVVLLLLVLPAVAALVWMPPRMAWAAVGGLAALGLLLLWAVQFSALLRLDHPHAARTVPGHPFALRATAAGLWLSLVGLCGGVSALAGALLGAPVAVSGLAVALGMATALLFIAVATRWWWAWLALSLAGSLGGLAAWRALVGQVWAGLVHARQVQPLALALALLLAQGLLLCSLFGAGDDRHARAYAQRERMRKILAAGAVGQKPTLAAYGRWGEWLGSPLQRAADAWLAHVCRAATARTASVMARAEIVLHGPQHWLRQVGTALLVQGVLLLSFTVVIALTGTDLVQFFSRGQVGIAIGVASMAMSSAVSLPGALWMSRREQALLMLLPGMPQGVALNRALAWRQLRHGLTLWLALLPGLLAVAWAGQVVTLLCFLALVPPLSAMAWRDVSRLRAPRPSAAMAPMVLCLLGGMLAQFLVQASPGLLWPGLLGLVLLTAGLLAWRWRCAVRLPQALPAGRLG